MEMQLEKISYVPFFVFFFRYFSVTNCFREITGHPEGNVYAVAFTPCDMYLVTGSGLGDLRVWDVLNMQVKFMMACVMQMDNLENQIGSSLNRIVS